MAYSLKNLKINKMLSQETSCFSAALYRDGQKVGLVTNHGTGGPDNYSFISKAEEEAFIGQFKDKKYPWLDADVFIGGLMERVEDQKMAKKMAKKGYPVTVILRKGWSVYPDGSVFWNQSSYCGVKSEADAERAAMDNEAEEFEIIKPE